MRVLKPRWDDVAERMTACHCNEGGCAECEGLTEAADEIAAQEEVDYPETHERLDYEMLMRDGKDF